MKKFFSLVLALVMALSLTTMAWGADVSYTVDSSNPVSATNFHTLEDAVAAVNAGDNATITLLEEVELATMLQLTIAANITIDGNGNKISPAASFTPDYLSALIMLGDISATTSATYTLKNIVFDGFTAQNVVRIAGVTAIVSNCTFTDITADGVMISVKDADVDVMSCNFEGNACAGVIYSADSTGSLDVSGCSFVENDVATATIGGYAVVYTSGSAAVTIMNNTFDGNEIDSTASNGAVIYADAVTASDNTFTDNTVAATGVRAGAVVADEGEVIGNVFSGNAASSSASGTTYVATVVAKGGAGTELDVDANYWDGATPDFADAKPVDGETHIAADNYYTTAVGGALGGLIYTATGTPDATLDKKATSYDNLYAKSTTLPATAPTTEVDIVVTPAKAVKYNKTTGYIDDVGNVEYVNITGDATYYMFVNTLAKADVVLYKDAAGKQVKFYLDEIETPYYVEGVAFANFGEKCGQVDYDEDDGYDKTLKYFTVKGLDFFDVFEEAEVGAYNDGYVMYNGKLVPVVGLGVDKVPHTAIYTTKNGVVESIECGACGLKAVKVPNALSMPKDADVVDGETVWYWPAAGSVSAGTTTGKVESAQTFDAGIAMYVGMSVMAAAGSAVVIGKKKD